MKKRIFSLVMAVFMLLSVFMTSCSSSTDSTAKEEDVIEQEESAAREALTIVLTLMTGDETTEEAIKAVQRRINEITRQRFKTNIVLRYFKESEYDEKLNELIAQIAVDESAKADEDALAKESEEEAKRINAIDKLMDKDRPEKKDEGVIKIFNQEFIPRETEEVTTVEEVETELTDIGISMLKYPTASESQLDIFLIRGSETLSAYVNDEKYATDGEPFLVPMDEWFQTDAKILTQYINPSVLLGGKIGNSTYAIPTNRQIASEYKYIVINKPLAEKHGINIDKVKTLTDTETIKFLRAVKANETGVAPMLAKPESAPGIVGLFPGEETIFGAYVSNAATVGLRTEPKNLLSAWQYTDHVIYMEQFERNGYFANDPNAETKFGIAVMTGDESFPETMNSDEYVVKVLEKPIATTETTGEYMLGISKYTEDAERCMEIITYLNTNSVFRNLIQYGIEDENYKLDEDTGKLVRLNREYMMDIYSTGNAFIAYPEEDMELDVWEKAKATNLSTVVSPYLGFIFENEKNAETIAAVKVLSENMLKRVAEFDPEAKRVQMLDAAKANLASEQAKLAEAQKSLDENQAIFNKYQAQADALAAALAVEQEKYSNATLAHFPYADKVTVAESKLENKQARLDEAKAEEEPDQDKITKLESELAELQAEYDAAVAAAKPTGDAVDAARVLVDAAQKALDDYLATDTGIPAEVEEGEEARNYTVGDIKNKITAAEKNITAANRNIRKYEGEIEDLQYTTEQEYDEVAESVYRAFFKELIAELQTDENYNKFMDSTDENSVVTLYNEWYNSMYAS